LADKEPGRKQTQHCCNNNDANEHPLPLSAAQLVGQIASGYEENWKLRRVRGVFHWKMGTYHGPC
ncbi:MAG TPA: hypothetical protein VEH31_15060, partial [Streptosporangiaceae bacterium]|nr:hypothetical protein [Streptosporangiaceae bacterium]